MERFFIVLDNDRTQVVTRMRFLALVISLVATTFGVAGAAGPAQPMPAASGAPATTGAASVPGKEAAVRHAIPRPRLDRDVERKIQLRTMLGQMIVVGFPGGPEWPGRIAQMVHDGAIGGVILFADNVADPRQVKNLVSSFQVADRRPPPFVMVDQEGGIVQRLAPAKGFPDVPSAERVATKDQASAYKLYRREAQELADLGFNVNLGPVVDLNIDSNSPAIGRLGRSFGRDPAKVIAYARQFIDAHRQVGVLTVAKHFPGHGSATADPHEQVVDITHTWQDVELEPFHDLIDDNFVDMIMVGHLVHPRFSDGDRPASLSKRAIQDVLRRQMGYNGLVITDDLDMGAIRERYGLEEAAVMAVAAGADLVIVANTKFPDPNIAERITAALSQAVAQGRIRKEAIEQSYRRIMMAKKTIIDRRAYVMQ